MKMNKHAGAAAGAVKALLWIYSSFIFLILLYMTYDSFRTRNDILSSTFGGTDGFVADSYKSLFVDDHFYLYFLNSVVILVASMVLLIFFSSLTAYGIARYSFKFKKAVRIYFLIGMMFPVQLGIVPIFLMMKQFQLINNLFSVILVSAAGVSMPVFMLTDFFQKLPKEIYEAAIVDGAGEWKTFSRIMFPMAKPVIFSVCVIVSVQIWNQFFLPLVFLQKESLKTIPLIVMEYTNNLINTMDLAMGASVLSTVPILILFIVFSNKIIDGITSGAVKG